MKWTIRHYYPFGGASELAGENLLSANAWERLRLSSSGSGEIGAFHLPDTRAEWLRLCQGSPGAVRTGGDIAALVGAGQYHAVLSIGVGRATAEFHLKAHLPNVKLTCTEYSPGVVARLRDVFTECDEVRLFDIIAGSWPSIPDRCLVLLNRVDTELDDLEWRRAFDRMAEAGAADVLLVATGFLTPRTIAREVFVRVSSMLRQSPLTLAGYTRTQSRMRDLWQPRYQLAAEPTIGTLSGFLLKRVR